VQEYCVLNSGNNTNSHNYDYGCNAIPASSASQQSKHLISTQKAKTIMKLNELFIGKSEIQNLLDWLDDDEMFLGEMVLEETMRKEVGIYASTSIPE
jgi:hypothetical protein